MTISALQLFTIGIGPSSSHTVGPMRAAWQFLRIINAHQRKAEIVRIGCDLYGSLAATGKGHGTDVAIMLGFLGEEPELVDVDAVPAKLAALRQSGRLELSDNHVISFHEKSDIAFKRLKPLPLHPNGMYFFALDATGGIIAEEVIYSLGGGFIATEKEMQSAPQDVILPYPFKTASELMQLCQEHQLTVSELMLANE